MGDVTDLRPALVAAASSWAPVDLAPIVRGIEAGEIVGPVPALLPRTDGAFLLYPGQVHSLAGEPASGKGWLMLAESARLLPVPARVVYLDFEDGPANIAARLMQLGAPAAAIAEQFVYVQPEAAPTPEAVHALAERRPALVVIDGVSEAFALLGLDSYANQDVPQFLRTLARPLADSGAAVVLVDHVVKDTERRGRYALGAQGKLAGVATAYTTDVIDAPSRAKAGTVKLVIAKDRHGHVGATGATAALYTITPHDEGARVTVRIEPGDGTTDDGDGFRPTVLMERISRFVESSPGATKRDVRDLVTGKHEWKDKALGKLVAEGWIRVEIDGRAQRHYVVEPFEEGATCPCAPDVSQRAPDTSCAHVPHVPPSYKEGHKARAHTGDDDGTVPLPIVPPLDALTADRPDAGDRP